MIRKTSSKCTTTCSSSTHKKKEEIDGFASISLSSKQLKHLVSLCTKDTRSYPMCECTICEEYLFAEIRRSEDYGL